MHGIMHISMGLALLSALGAAAPAPQRVVPRAPSSDAGSVAPRQNNPNDTAQLPSDTQIRNAVMSWANDTGKVTQFMNTATSFTGDEYTRQAQIALNAELDELNHKKILDAALSNDPNVQSANDVLENQGTFQNVVTVLENMVNNGPDTAQADVDTINNNRCVNVLPNIDAYFAAAGMPEVTAVRPTGCLEVEGAPEATGALPPPPAAQNPGNNSNVTSAPAQATSTSSAGNGGTSASEAEASETSESSSSNGNGAASASITSSEDEAASATSSVDDNEAASETSSAAAEETED